MIEGFSYENVKFDDGRGKYPEEVKVLAPLGTRERVKRAASAEGVTVSEFVRRAILERIGRSTSGQP